MATIKQLVEIKQQADAKRRSSDFAFAVTGKFTDDGTGGLTINENLQTNQMHARLGGPTGQPVVVNYVQFDGTIGVGIVIRRNPLNRKEWQLDGPDYAVAQQSFTAALPGLFEAAIPGELSKNTVVARQLQMLRLTKTATASMTVKIKAGWFAVDGAFNWFSGSATSTISAPGSSNQRQWYLVGIDPDTMALTEQAGTARDSSGNLSITELTDLVATYPAVYWVGAVELYNGMTAIYEDDITDLRPFGPDMGFAMYDSAPTRAIIIPSGKAALWAGSITITGDLTVDGDLTIIG